MSVRVSQCPRVPVLSTSFTESRSGLDTHKTRQEVLKIPSSVFFPENETRLYIEVSTPQELRKKDWFRAEAFCPHCQTLFEASPCLHHYCPFQEAKLSVTEESSDTERKRAKKMKCQNSTS